MIARRIVYHGTFSQDNVSTVFDITRKVDITGFVKANGTNQIELNLEGDPSMIKLIQHLVERAVTITDKTVDQIPYQNYSGVTLLN